MNRKTIKTFNYVGIVKCDPVGGSKVTCSIWHGKPTRDGSPNTIVKDIDFVYLGGDAEKTQFDDVQVDHGAFEVIYNGAWLKKIDKEIYCELQEVITVQEKQLWCKTGPPKSFAERTARELRNKCRELGITGCSRMNKSDLIDLLKRR